MRRSAGVTISAVVAVRVPPPFPWGVHVDRRPKHPDDFRFPGSRVDVRIPILRTASSRGSAAGGAIRRRSGAAKDEALGSHSRNLRAFFGMLNIASTILVPGSQSRWDQAMQTIYSQWGFPSLVPQFHFPIWLITVPAIPIFLIELGFVITQKTAFLATVKPPS